MSYEFSEGVASALAERGWLVDGRLKRADIARGVAEWLQDGHVAESVDDVQDVAATVDEIALGLLGTTDAYMHDVMAALTGPRGEVQYAGLSDGLVLASVRVSREVVVEGIPPRPRKFSARLLSADPEVLQGTIIFQQASRYTSALDGTNDLLGTIGKRVPELAADRARVLTEIAEKATRLAATALNSGTE